MKPRIDKRSPIPLYRQLYNTILDQIDIGALQPGDRLPSERELGQMARVSRTTARIAIDEMVASGLAYREQGRGTFVAEPRMRSLMGFTSFTEDIIARGMQPSSLVISQKITSANARVAGQLKIEPGDEVLYLVRLRLADDKPVALQRTYLPMALVPGLETHNLTNKSLFKILRVEYGIYPEWTEAELEAVEATEELTQQLDVQPGAPILVVRGLTFSESFERIETVETYYRGQGMALYIGRQRLDTSTR